MCQLYLKQNKTKHTTPQRMHGSPVPHMGLCHQALSYPLLLGAKVDYDLKTLSTETVVLFLIQLGLVLATQLFKLNIILFKDA